MEGEQLAVEDLEKELGELGYEDDEQSDVEYARVQSIHNHKKRTDGSAAAISELGKRGRGSNEVHPNGLGKAAEAGQEEEEEERGEKEDVEEEEQEQEENESEEDDEDVARTRRKTQPKQGPSIATLEPSVTEIWARHKPQRKRQRPRRGKTAGCLLPEDIAYVLGQATSAYIMGDHQTAAELFKEVVRQAPQHPDAYQTLAVIHQEKEEPQEALELFYIAAKLTSSDAGLWKKVANLAYDLGYLDRAVEAFRHTIRLEPHPHIMLQLAHTLLRKKSYRSAHDQVDRMLIAFPEATDGLVEYAEHCLACGRKDFAEWGYRVYALSCMDGVEISPLLADNVPANLARTMPEDAPHLFSVVSTLLEFYLEGSDKDATKGLMLVDMCLDLLQRLRDPTFDSASKGRVQEDQALHHHDDHQQQPLTLPLDIATKYGLCHLKLGHTLPAMRALQPLLNASIDESDEALQVVELKQVAAAQYFSKGMSTQAAKLLQSIFDSKIFDTLPVQRQTRLWLEYSDVQEKLGHHDAALQSVLAALDLSQNYTPAIQNFARLARTSRPDMQMHAASTLYTHLLLFAELIEQQHAPEAALTMQEAQVEIEVAIEWTLACQQSGDEIAKQNYIAAAEPLVDAWLTQASHSPDDHKAQVHSIPLSALRASAAYTSSPDYLWLSESQNKIRNHLAALAGAVKLHSFVAAEDMFQMLLELLQTLLQSNRESQATSIVQRAMSLTARPLTEPQRDQLRALCHHLLGGIADLRTVTFNAFIASPGSVPLANAVSRMLRTPESTGTQSLSVSSVIPVGKLLKQSPDSLPLNIFSAHNCVARHLHAEAMTRYFDGFLLDPQQPLTNLSIGTHLLNLSSHPSISDKRTLAVQAVAMLFRYSALRTSDESKCALSLVQRKQEALYNVGRAFHQIELLHLAEHYYRASLDIWDQHKHDDIEVSNTVTLEAAHNLVQIYRESNARELALQIMARYLTVNSIHS